MTAGFFRRAICSWSSERSANSFSKWSPQIFIAEAVSTSRALVCTRVLLLWMLPSNAFQQRHCLVPVGGSRALQAAKPAIQALYQALTPEQRAIFDPFRC